MNIQTEIQSIIPEVRDWRRYLHTRPETAFEENETSRFVADKLASFGLDVDTGLAGTGVVGTLKKGSAGGDAVALRADMDGLAILEENVFDHRSQNEGKMHACGHDGHMAMLLGTARGLAERGGFSGTVHFIFQPAEENEGGGGKMVSEGLFEQYPVKSVFGMHNFPGMPFGSFATCTGPMMAAFDIFDIVVTGSGGHGAMPHLAKDPIIASAHLINHLQSVVSRNVDPMEQAVVSVTQVTGGTAYNIIPAEVSLRGTTRHFKAEIQDLVESRMNEIVDGVSLAMGVRAELRYERRYPALVNTPEETELAVRVAGKIAGEKNVSADMAPLMGSEDFAFLLQKRPGNFMALGAGEPRPGGRLHQSMFDFNDEILPLGIAYWQTLVEELLPA